MTTTDKVVNEALWYRHPIGQYWVLWISWGARRATYIRYKEEK